MPADMSTRGVADSEALRSDCADVRNDKEVLGPHVSEYPHHNYERSFSKILQNIFYLFVYVYISTI